ncbi:hypothetical protein E4U41_000122 [Claviceps citrina]|nr:hypothetical protein E4U41_000122 [Claviceps citrina]
MAANMQQMAGVGQMVPQQLRRTQTPLPLQQIVYQNIVANSQPANSLTWQASVNVNDRMGKTMDLYVSSRNPSEPAIVAAMLAISPY